MPSGVLFVCFFLIGKSKTFFKGKKMKKAKTLSNQWCYNGRWGFLPTLHHSLNRSNYFLSTENFRALSLERGCFCSLVSRFIH